jgi:hypothetical protein
MTHEQNHDHSHNHSHEHKHSDDQGHSHSHNHGEEMSLEQKLDTLFSHWIDHNDSHKDNFLSWAKKAREAGLTQVASSLEQAGSLSCEVTKKLEQALANLADSKTP